MLRKLNVFLAFMSGQPCKTMYLYRRAPQLGSSILSEGGVGGIFQHLGTDVSRALVYYISVTLPLLKVRWRAAGLSALGHGYLSHLHTHTHPPRTCTCIYTKKADFLILHIYIYVAAVPSCFFFLSFF